jgi:transposase
MTLVGGDGERVERPRRRSWSAAAKQLIVEESLQPGASVSIVARRHDINANQLFTWRRLARSGELISCSASPGFVPALMTAAAPGSGQQAPAEEIAAAGSGSSAPAATTGRMEIVLAGGYRVIVDEGVNAAALARVIGVLERR